VTNTDSIDVSARDGRHTRYIVKYALIAVYGAWSALVGIPTIREISGALVESLWPWLIVIAAVVAIIGVVRSKLTNRHTVEVAGIILLLAFLAGYAITIYARCIFEGTWTRAPTGLLPVIVMVTPFGRLLDIARRHIRKADT